MADSITFTGSNIPMGGCKIQAIQGGHVHYLDARGQRQRREIEQVRALAFDGLPELDMARAESIGDDPQRTFMLLAHALVKANTDVQRLWIHTRLAAWHRQRGEIAQAAGHAAAAMALSDDPYWTVLEPDGKPALTGHPAIVEALEHLRAAGRAVKNDRCKASVGRMLQAIERWPADLTESSAGSTGSAGGTISGISRAQINQYIASLGAPPPLPQTRPAEPKPAPPADRRAERPSPPEPAPASDALVPPIAEPDSPQAIDILLTNGKWSEALEACRRAELDPGDRDLGLFLFQYGRALSGARRPLDAAVMFTRCAVLFRESEQAPHALIQTALIHRDQLGKPEVARRLLESARELAREHENDAAALLAGELLQSRP